MPLSKEKAREAYCKNKEKFLASQKKTRFNRRKRVLDHYGGKCACCENTQYEFLSIDHIGGVEPNIEKLLEQTSTDG